MKRTAMILAAALICAGCGKFESKEETARKEAAAEEVSSKAQAKLAARLAEKDAVDRSGQVAEALAALLCSSPKTVEGIQNDSDLLDALSGAGGDREEMRKQFNDARNRYRAVLERQLPPRGAEFADFTRFAADRETPDARRRMKSAMSQKCPKGDQDALLKAADDLMSYFSGPSK